MATKPLLEGAFSVVTGGASGIGKAICARLAANGSRILVVDRVEEAARAAAAAIPNVNGLPHASFACDVSQSAQVASLAEFAFNEAGRPPGVVVSCAGITRDSTLLKMKEDQFDDVISVNLKGVFLVGQAFAKAAIQAQLPLSIINISSIVGKVGNFGQTNYAASKAGVVGFTKSAAKELSKKGVRVNAVLPGFVRTPMTEAMPKEVLASICAGIPCGRMGEAEEIADAVVFLASPLSTYVNGATLEVTGGLYM